MGNKAKSGLPKGVKDTTSRIKSKGDFRIFTDKAYDGWTFQGDGKATINFFRNNSNYVDLIQNMSYEELKAFQLWSDGHFMRGQQYGKFSNMSLYNQDLTRVYDKILDKAYLDKGIVVHRLAGFELINNGSPASMTLSDMKSLIGQQVTSRGNMSTAAAAEGLTIGSSKSVDYEIHIPGKTTGAGMWIGNTKLNSWGNRQREFLVNRDTAYTIKNVTYNKSTKRYTVILHYEGRLEHDYS